MTARPAVIGHIEIRQGHGRLGETPYPRSKCRTSQDGRETPLCGTGEGPEGTTPPQTQ